LTNYKIVFENWEPNIKNLFLYSVIMLLAAFTAFSKSDKQGNGLLSSWVTCFATKGNYVFAGTCGGVFLSTDNGNSWTEKNTDLTIQSVQAIVTSGNNIFVGTYLGGVFISTNNGGSWGICIFFVPFCNLKCHTVYKIDFTKI